MKAAAKGELELVRTLRDRAGRAPVRAVRLGIGDDCAILRPPAGHEVLVTTDLCLEGSHFRRDWHSAQSAGHRCLARGLSDLTAMGATPLAAFLSLTLPPPRRATAAGRRWGAGFLDGLRALAATSKTPLAGGDTAASPANAVLADIVLLGSAPRGKALRRSGARPGDLLYVTGALGGSAAELKSLAARPGRFLTAANDGTHPQLFPTPRLAVGRALLRRGLATSAIDLSDGLSTDLHHLCDESRAGAIVHADSLPLHPLARTHANPLGLALHGGEDYELLFTAHPDTTIPRTMAGVRVTPIGEITTTGKVILQRNGKRERLRPGGWEHSL